MKTLFSKFPAIGLSVSLMAVRVFAAAPTSDVAKPGAQEPVNSMMAGSPVTSYTAAVMGYMIWIGILVSVLLIGGLLFINIGLLSKREEDKTGHREPSDVDILASSIWQKERHFRPRLPAEEDEDQFLIDHDQPYPNHIDPNVLVREENMVAEMQKPKRLPKAA